MQWNEMSAFSTWQFSQYYVKLFAILLFDQGVVKNE